MLNFSYIVTIYLVKNHPLQNESFEICSFAFIFFDFRVSKSLKDICSLVNSSYIGMVWCFRNESMGITTLKRKLIEKIKYNTHTVLMCPNVKGNLRKLFLDLDQRCETLYIVLIHDRDNLF